eukprot:7379169-Prymnesium_polylepis.1
MVMCIAAGHPAELREVAALVHAVAQGLCEAGSLAGALLAGDQLLQSAAGWLVRGDELSTCERGQDGVHVSPRDRVRRSCPHS